MRAYVLVINELGKWLPRRREGWRKRLIETLQAAMEAGHLSLTELGRHLPGPGTLKSKVKKMWRRLSRPQTEQHQALYRAIAHALLQDVAQPILLVDWTICNGMYLLCCALAHEGRALPLYVEVRPLGDYGKVCVEHQWLTTLRQRILPACRPLLCTDAGFRSDWFATAEALGFDYIGRLPPYVQLQPVHATSCVWVETEVLGLASTATPEDLGEYFVCKGKPVRRRVVRYRGQVPRRPDQRRGPSPRGGANDKKYRRMAQLGWVLVTSVPPQQADAEQLVALYTLRMQVEELFRSIKSRMYGQGAGESRSRRSAILADLWSVASIQEVVLHLVGRLAEVQGWAKHYQTNTAKRRVLSLPRLGALVLQHHDLRQVTPQRLQQALLDVRQQAARPAPGQPGSRRLQQAISDIRCIEQSQAAAA